LNLEKIYSKLKNQLAKLKEIIDNDSLYDFNERKKNLSKIFEENNNLIIRIMQNDFLKLYYQGLIRTFRKEFNDIEVDINNAHIKKYIYVHYRFVKLISEIYEFNMTVFEECTNNLNSNIEENVNINVFSIIKKALVKAGINENLIDDYYKSLVD
jgi:short-subunit dehydrogenase